MKDVATGGRTVLFVSHNMGAVQALCSKGIVLHEGKVVFQGAATDAVRQYREKSATSAHAYIGDDEDKRQNRIRSLKIYQEGESETLDVKKPIHVGIEYEKESSRTIVASLHIYNEDDAMVIHSSPEISERAHQLAGASTVKIETWIPAKLLHVGKYYCSVILAERNKAILESLEKKISFTVVDPEFRFAATNANDWKGILSPRCIQWEIKTK